MKRWQLDQESTCTKPFQSRKLGPEYDFHSNTLWPVNGGWIETTLDHQATWLINGLFSVKNYNNFSIINLSKFPPLHGTLIFSWLCNILVDVLCLKSYINVCTAGGAARRENLLFKSPYQQIMHDKKWTEKPVAFFENPQRSLFFLSHIH